MDNYCSLPFDGRPAVTQLRIGLFLENAVKQSRALANLIHYLGRTIQAIFISQCVCKGHSNMPVLTGDIITITIAITITNYCKEGDSRVSLPNSLFPELNCAGR